MTDSHQPQDSLVAGEEHAWAGGLVSKRSVMSGGALSAAAWGTSLALGMPITLILVRVMSRSQFGDLSLATSILNLATPLAGFGIAAGLATTGAMAIAAEGSAGLGTVVRSAVRAIRVLVPAVVVFSVGVLAFLAQSPHLQAAAVPFAVLAPVLLSVPVRDASQGLLQVQFRPGVQLVASVLSSSLVIGATLGAIAIGRRSAASMAAARTLPILLGVAVLAWGARWEAGMAHPVGSMKRWPVLRVGLSLVVATSVTQAISQLDVVTLGVLRGPVPVAGYAPVSKVADVILAVVGVVGSYLLPALGAALGRGDIAEARDLYHWASRWALALASPGLVAMMIVPGPLLRLLFGSASAGLQVPARILAVGVTINIALGFNWLVLAASGERRSISICALSGLLTSGVGCAVFIPHWDATGAALATTAALVEANLAASVWLWRRHAIPPWDKAFAITAFSFAAAGCLASAARDLVNFDAAWLLVVLALLCGLTTCLSALLVGGADERNLIREIARGVTRRLKPTARTGTY